MFDEIFRDEIETEELPILERFESRRAKLQQVSELLKKDFIGLDEIIDSFIEKVEAWYVMPESMRRPAIICLWGMTGIGKTDLIRKFIRYINFSDKYLEIQMTNNGSSRSDYWNTSIQSKIEMSNLEPATPGVLFLDEIQRYRTKNEDGKSVSDIKDQDIWQLLSDGKFATSTRRIQLYEMLFSGLLYDSSARSWGTESESVEDDDEDEKPKKPGKYKRGYYTARKIKRLLKLDEDVKTIMEWSDESKEEIIKNALKNDEIFEGDDYSKLLIVVSGNIDEAYRMANSVSDGDIDADVLHDFSKKINFLKIKQALLERFYPEQIARFGNNHIVYPSLNKKSYEQVIHKTISGVSSDVQKAHGININFDDTVYSFVYRNGVFPSQGVRPVFSTIYASVENLTPKIIISAIENDVKDIVVKYNNSTNHFDIHSKDSDILTRLFSVEYSGDVDKIKSKIPDDLRIAYAVHEIGHAIAYSHMFGFVPTQIEPNSANGGAFVGLHSIVETKRFCEKKIKVSLAGRAAEKLVFGEVTSGSESDIIVATATARSMLKKWGMGQYIASIGTVGLQSTEYHSHIANTQNDFDEIKTISKILKESEADVREVLRRYSPLLIELSRELFETEKMPLERYVELCAKHGMSVQMLEAEKTIMPGFLKKFEEFSCK